MKREIVINEQGDTIPIYVDKLDELYIITVGGTFWCATPSQEHAETLCNMMADHITEYQHFEKR